MKKTIFCALTPLLASLAFSTSVFAGETTVGVAANFTATAKEIAEAFETETGHKAILAFGSTGKLYTQIAHGAPFEVFLAADQARPEKVETEGLGVEGTRFTYAKGKIVLYSMNADLVDEEGLVLKSPDKFKKLAIANPKTAPYGSAAIEAMQKLAVFDGVKDMIVRGDNIAQTFQFVMTQNAQLGFVAYSQVVKAEDGSSWIVPDNLYTPIRQDAILLKKGAESDVAQAFITFLKSDTARAIIESYGYGLDK